MGAIKDIVYDPLLRNVDLARSGVYFPLGFQAEIATNSCDVLAAAQESWGDYASAFDCQPVRLRIAVQPGSVHPVEPAFRQQGSLFSIVSDRDNYAICDFESLAGCAFLTEATVSDRAWMRWYFLEALVAAALEQRYTAALHAACVAKGSVGILLCGPSGAGKSTLAFACARTGWTYLGDESTYLLLDREDRLAVGKPHRVRLRPDAAKLFPELQGRTPKGGPNGKVSIEVVLRDMPQIQTASQCRIGAVVLLERTTGRAPQAEPVSSTQAAEALLREKPFYGEISWARHEKAVSRLADVPNYRLAYDSLDDAVGLLCGLAQKAF